MTGIRTPREYERTIETLMDSRAWTRARWVVKEQLLDTPDEHWLLAQLAWTYLADGRFDDALATIDRAALIAPGCPTVLWYRTEILCALEDRSRAANTCRALIELGPGVAIGECGVGQRRGAELLTEAIRRLSQLEVGQLPATCPVDAIDERRRHTRVIPTSFDDEAVKH